MEEREKIVPTCKYGHGPLQRFDEGEKPYPFVIEGFARFPETDRAKGVPRFSFTFHLYTCPRCTYVEMHDDRQWA